MSTKKRRNTFIFISGEKRKAAAASRGIGARIQSSLGKGGNVEWEGVSLPYLKWSVTEEWNRPGLDTELEAKAKNQAK